MCRLHNAVTTINVALFSADANKNSGLSKKKSQDSPPLPPSGAGKRTDALPSHAYSSPAELARNGKTTLSGVSGFVRRFRRPFGREPIRPSSPADVRRTRCRAPREKPLISVLLKFGACVFVPPGKKPAQFFKASAPQRNEDVPRVATACDSAAASLPLRFSAADRLKKVSFSAALCRNLVKLFSRIDRNPEFRILKQRTVTL